MSYFGMPNSEKIEIHQVESIDVLEDDSAPEPQTLVDRVTKRVKRLDLRFPDMEEEHLFKSGLESDLLRWMCLGSILAAASTLFNSIGTFGPELFTDGHNLFDFSDVRNCVFFTQLVLWTLVPAVVGSLIGLRLALEWFAKVNWEVVITGTMVYGSVVIVVGQLFHLTVLLGGEPEREWKTNVTCSAEAWVLLGLNSMTTAAAFFLPLRSIMSWTVPVSGLVTYSLMKASIKTDSQASQIIVKILLLIVLSYLAWHGAARTEKHLRTEWRAKRELEKASEQMEQQQQVIQAKGQEVLEKDAKVKETMELVKSLQTVAKALCDTMVHLTDDLRIRNSDTSESFFERDVEGQLFTELLSETDQVRFSACIQRAAQSHIPVCLPVTLQKLYTTSEVHLVLVHRGNTELRYLIGIRVEKDGPYVLPTEASDQNRRAQPRTNSGGPSPPRGAAADLPGAVPDAHKQFAPVLPRQIRAIDEDSESDFSFTTYPKNEIPRPPKFTNFRARARTIRMILKRWNVPRDCESCCQYHTVLDSIDEAVDCLRQQKCDPLWSTYGEQCPRCACMNQGPKCVVCGYVPDNNRAAASGGARPSNGRG